MNIEDDRIKDISVKFIDTNPGTIFEYKNDSSNPIFSQESCHNPIILNTNNVKNLIIPTDTNNNI